MIFVSSLDGSCFMMLSSVKSGPSHLEFLHFWQFLRPLVSKCLGVLFFIVPEGKLLNKCFPEGGESYLEELDSFR